MRNHSLYLVDSSVWIEALSARGPDSPLRQRVADLLEARLAATTGVVRLELLGAISNEAEYQRRVAIFDALPVVATRERHWDEAARLGSQLRRQGLTIPSTDLLIAAVAMDSGATVLHRDRHFDLIAQHAPLSVESHVAAGAS